MLKRGAIIGIALTIALLISGCKEESTAAAAMGETTAKAVVVANPQEAVNEIYESLKSYDAVDLDSWRLKEYLEIESDDLVEYHGKISDVNEGLADVVIIIPKENKRDDVQLALSKYKERKIAEFENYDILDAYTIAQNAVIYDQGNYMIMLMLSDNIAARAIIDEHIPL